MAKLTVGVNDLRTVNSVLAAELHTRRNGLLTPEHLTAGSHQKVWWERECSPGIFHEWEAVVKSRALSNNGCPVCSGYAILVGYNDLGTAHPAIADEWHPKKNGLLTSEQVTAGSGKKVWWERECSPGILHEWEAVVNDRTQYKTGCPVCNGNTVLVGYNDLGTTHIVIADEWHKEKNGSLTPEHCSAGSNKKVWWEKECSPGVFHEWGATVQSRALRNSGCPFCSRNTILAGYNDLGTTHPVIADQLHRQKNGLLAPEHLAAGSHKKVWWERECAPGIFHEWEATIKGRALNDRGCPICAGYTVLIGYNDLGTTHILIADEWHKEKNGSLTPELVTAGTNKKVWWEKECSPGVFHEWETRITNRTFNNSGCPFCSRNTILAGYNDLGTTHPAIADEWHPEKNGLLTPEHLAAGSHKKVWWERECAPGLFHEWEAEVKSRALSNNGCPVCPTGKTEKLFRESFEKQTGYNLQSSRIQLDRLSRLTNRAQIDMLNDNLKLVIEYDGEWTHGVRSPEGKTLEQKLAEDKETTQALVDIGYKVIRIREYSNRGMLPFVPLDPECEPHVFQIAYKSFGKDKDGIEELVQRIIEEKADWFKVDTLSIERPSAA